uniref:Uncharacterized protein n=1 Tax=Trachysalambria curvirostris majanivirus TaxID=2984281 RepID=A0A9C7BQY8_9VIRU|nr:MAG: hypothetical protein [Trachysalambria curvirostris majanivirus]
MNHIDYDRLFIDYINSDITALKNRIHYYLTQIKSNNNHNLIFNRGKIYSVSDVMELASVKQTCSENIYINEYEQNINIITILIYGILKKGWDKNTIKDIETELIDRCLYFNLINQKEYDHLKKRRRKESPKGSTNSNIKYIVDILWTRAHFNQLYKDRHFKKERTLKLINKINLPLSKDILINHDLSLFSLPIAAGIVIYDYLTAKNIDLTVVKKSSSLLVNNETYLRYSSKEEKQDIYSHKNSDNVFTKITSLIKSVGDMRKSEYTNCAILLCKSFAKDNKDNYNKKSELFNLNWLFMVTHIDNVYFRKYLSKVYDNINVNDIINNSGINKPLNWYYRSSSIANNINITSSYYGNSATHYKYSNKINDKLFLNGTNSDEDFNETYPLYENIEDGIYTSIKNLTINDNREDGIILNIDNQSSIITQEDGTINNNNIKKNEEWYKTARRILPTFNNNNINEEWYKSPRRILPNQKPTQSLNDYYDTPKNNQRIKSKVSYFSNNDCQYLSLSALNINPYNIMPYYNCQCHKIMSNTLPHKKIKN